MRGECRMADLAEVQARIERLSSRPMYYREIMEHLEDCEYRTILLAWGEVRRRRPLERDSDGRYWLAGAGTGQPERAVD